MVLLIAVVAFFLKGTADNIGSVAESVDNLESRVSVIEENRWSFRDHVVYADTHSGQHQEHAKKHTEWMSLLTELQIQVGQVIERLDGYKSPELDERISKLSDEVRDIKVDVVRLEAMGNTVELTRQKANSVSSRADDIADRVSRLEEREVQ